MNLRFWRKREIPQSEPIRAFLAIEGQPSETGASPIRLVLDQPVKVHHTIEHKPRPPAPRPERITVVYQMQDGREIRTHIPLHGQAEWTEAWPHWLDPRNENWPPVAIRYHLGYSDSGY